MNLEKPLICGLSKLDITSLSVSKLQKLLLKKQDCKSDTVFYAWMIT